MRTRIGIVGLGSMGMQHATYLAAGAVAGAELAAVCTRDAGRLAEAGKRFPGVVGFAEREEFFSSVACDAVIVATPHYDHAGAIREAFDRGLHVLVEKPLAVSVKAGREIVAEYGRHGDLKFGIMYNQRTNPLYQRMREIVRSGALGKISRVTWIITHWFRPNAYYASSPWRATWKGEGGGVLINQSIHNLDLLQWIMGEMPVRVTAIATTGKFHPIEVEDDVSAILEYAGGCVGHFITTTGEHPGSNRLEIAGTGGRLLAEGGTLTITEIRPRSDEFCRESAEAFGVPESSTRTERFEASKDEHQKICQDFVNAIRNGLPNERMIAPGPEGVRALELANAMLMAGLTREAVELPLDGEKYEVFLQGKILHSAI